MEAKHWALHRLTKIFSPPVECLTAFNPLESCGQRWDRNSPSLASAPLQGRRLQKSSPKTPLQSSQMEGDTSPCVPPGSGGGLMNN